MSKMSLGIERKQIQYPHMKVYGKNNLVVAIFLTFAGFVFAGCGSLQTSSSGKIWVASDMTALTSITKPFVDKKKKNEAKHEDDDKEKMDEGGCPSGDPGATSLPGLL